MCPTCQTILHRGVGLWVDLTPKWCPTNEVSSFQPKHKSHHLNTRPGTGSGSGLWSHNWYWQLWQQPHSTTLWSQFSPRKCPVRSGDRRLNNANLNIEIITTHNTQDYYISDYIFQNTMMKTEHKIYWTVSGHRICFPINHDREFDKLYIYKYI